MAASFAWCDKETPPIAKGGTMIEPAHDAYNRYGAYTDWKNYAGLPMPQWGDLPARIRNAWRAAVDDHPSFEPEPS